MIVEPHCLNTFFVPHVLVSRSLLGRRGVTISPSTSLWDGKFILSLFLHRKLIVIPKPEVPHLRGPPLFRILNEYDLIRGELPTLLYPVQIQIIEFQDWKESPSSLDDGHDPSNSDDIVMTATG